MKVFIVKDFQKFQNNYIDYGIDSLSECFGELFRVWNGRTLLGTFYKSDCEWKAIPYYQNRCYIGLERDLLQTLKNRYRCERHYDGA